MEKAVLPTFVGDGFRLVPFSSEYMSTIYNWESDPSSLYLWTIRKAIVSEAEFKEHFLSRLRQSYHVFLLILNSENKAVGFIYSYDANLVDGFTFVTTFLEQSSRGNGLGAKAGVLFYDYLFSYYPFRKIYCDVFEYNEESFSALTNAGFVSEGKFPLHRFFAGNYHTLHRLTLYREKFYDKFQRLISRLRSSN